jgi:3-oxoacyl-[acyl-carrier protein] reductase
VALVTGASRGIGRAIAATLAAQGFRVIGTATTPEGAQRIGEALAAHGGQGLCLDVNDAAAAEAAVEGIVKAHGALHVLVNNAGITRDTLAMRMKDADWDAVLDTNLKAVFRLCRAVMRPMMKQRYGRIVNITSVVGASGNAGQANYAAAKAGIASMTIVLARELERFGVRVNCIAPVALTRLTEDLMAPNDDLAAKLDPANIAAGVCWLASDLSEGVTGQVLKIQGGVAQIVQGWRPITEITSDSAWTIEAIAAQRATLFSKSDPGVPPFLLNISDPTA